MKADIYSPDGKKVSQAELPAVFDTPVRNDLIKRAVLSDLSAHFQPKGNDPRAGMETSARYRGRKEDYGSIKNRGISRLPREVLPGGRFGKVKRIPSSVKGRRAHPPKPEKVIFESMNKKEYALALSSAIAATAQKNVVEKRGHKISKLATLPIVFDAAFENIGKTKDVLKALIGCGLADDLQRAKQGKARRGSGSRKSGVKFPKSALIVSIDGSKVLSSARNIAGVDVKSAQKLRAADLAPGAHPGRLTVYTVGALAELGKKFGA